ncbi:helix-turn-helix domain-containing protein [Halocalculus aciditolerans]|uniref:Helix-turn-helix domain-containing protein n=1 Tax=Halocalculus aciditolerans TaxID=1383812 RepID=A0A830FIS8_9EURY|nr:helix-turn-helix domain-containing protein [Halocalculus aciditolerans]GGL60095.1 helix-turn-helix domain-containing protein [Halocalculus aciditolerans]
MPRVELVVTLPEPAWIGRISRAHSDAAFRVLSALPAPDGGVGLLELNGDDVDPLLAAVEAADLRDVSVLRRLDESALVQFETESPMLLRATQSSGVPLEFPFHIRDGEAHWTFTVSHDRLADLRTELDARGFDYRLDGVRGANQTEDALTDHQREVVLAALDAGYYEQPRDCSLTELAAELDVAKSTLSGVLRRAEAALVRAYADDT